MWYEYHGRNYPVADTRHDWGTRHLAQYAPTLEVLFARGLNRRFHEKLSFGNEAITFPRLHTANLRYFPEVDKTVLLALLGMHPQVEEILDHYWEQFGVTPKCKEAPKPSHGGADKDEGGDGATDTEADTSGDSNGPLQNYWGGHYMVINGVYTDTDDKSNPL